jgi:hypothetical protein
MAINSNVVYQAGDIELQSVAISLPDNKNVDIRSFIGELNLFEDIYATGLYGNILIVDAINLSQVLDLTGDEYLTLKFTTPGTNALIYKTFKVYSITDKMFISDTGKQTFIMHFCSPEVFIDSLTPIYKTYKKAKVHDHAKKVFEQHMAVSRFGGNEFTTLYIVGETDNEIQFTSPGWRPGKILNWLASKAKCRGYNNPNYFFYESNKAFYFANLELLIKATASKDAVYQEYFVTPSKINTSVDAERFADDIDKQYRQVINMRVIESYNALKNTQTGYLANRLFTFDVVNKKRAIYDYDHVASWNTYYHLGPRAPFPDTVLKSPAGLNQVQMQHESLYTDVKNNVGEQAPKILPIRTSSLAELSNFKIEITVPGRTDVEVGSIVLLHYPDASPKDASDGKLPKDDTLYSGKYLISAIRHQITTISHTMVLELVRDSLRGTST